MTRGRAATRLKGLLRPLAACALLACAAFAVAQSYADDLRRAIDVAARHPAFATGLTGHTGWTATGYDAGDRYGLWRVDFATAAGDPIGWAQVQLATERVWGWEATFGLEGEAYAEAEARLLDFLRDDPEFIGFGGDVDDREWVWVGYEEWRDTWVVHIQRSPSPLVVVLRSEHAWTRSLDDLSIEQIRVPTVVSVEEWNERSGSDAIAIAFLAPEVAAAVRGRDGWTADAELLDRGLWRVRFEWSGQTVAEADVDMTRREVVVRP